MESQQSKSSAGVPRKSQISRVDAIPLKFLHAQPGNTFLSLIHLGTHTCARCILGIDVLHTKAATRSTAKQGSQEGA